MQTEYLNKALYYEKNPWSYKGAHRYYGKILEIADPIKDSELIQQCQKRIAELEILLKEQNEEQERGCAEIRKIFVDNKWL